jgi:hypothetical protein
MSGALKLILEMGGESESEGSVECPKCGAECESDDKFCCDCGAKLPAPTAAVAKVRSSMLKGMAAAAPEED